MEEENKENEFERLLKQKAERFELKPSPGVWQNVYAAIQQNRRRKFAWWLLAALLFTVLGTGAYFMLQKNSGQKSASSIASNDADKKAIPGHIIPAGKKEHPEKEAATPAISAQIDSQIQQKTKTARQELPEVSLPKHPVQTSGKEKTSPATYGAASGISNEIPVTATPDNDSVNIPQAEMIQGMSIQNLKPLSNDDQLLFKKPVPDFTPVTASNYSLWFEADAMPLVSFVRNHETSSVDSNTGVLATPFFNSSYSFVKGFSAGGNLMLERNKKWLFGIGAHFSKTHLEAITAEQSLPQYDTVFIPIGDTTQVEVAFSGNALVQQSQHSVNQWFDISLFTGVSLFPDSKNHIRILAGAGYSRQVSSSTAAGEKSISPADATFGGTGALPNFQDISLSYKKNQVQLFSEIAYQRDLTSRWSFSTGLQLHYFPMNLLNSNEFSQRMVWLGLKGGILFRL